MNLPLLCACIAFFVMQAHCFGLTPPPEPHTHKVNSANGRYYARMDVRTDKVTVKQVRRWWFDKALWSMQGYFDWVEVADDGSFIYNYSPVFGRSSQKEQVVLRIWLRDGMERRVTLGQLVHDTARLESFVGTLWNWGRHIGNQEGWIRIETCEGRLIQVNAITGDIRKSSRSSINLR